MTDIVMMTFRLDGLFMKAADRIAGPGGLTAARWRVLGAVLSEARTVAEISRHMGLARQSVQPTADALVKDGFAEYLDNPRHKSAKLLAATETGLALVKGISERQSAWANRVSGFMDKQQLKTAHGIITELVKAIENNEAILDELPPLDGNQRQTAAVLAKA